jgi:predicted RNA-binding Zn ribbon-like protein
MSVAHHFPLVGEPLAVDLVNTLAVQKGLVVDLLASDDQANAWWTLHEDRLEVPAPPGGLDLERIRDLRAAIAVLFDAAMDGAAPPTAALDVVNAANSSGASFSRLAWSAAGPIVDAGMRGDAMATGLGAVARSAIEVLTGRYRGRLRRCEGPDCELIFLATNVRRRWCSPERCGNRVRAARHYRRRAPVRA